jgi:predicted nucleic acid-binding protein
MTEWVIVADSSPLIGLARIGQLEKQAGLISEVKPHLDALMANGIYIDRALINAVLKDVGET